jgi:hypothetical protein
MARRISLPLRILVCLVLGGLISMFQNCSRPGQSLGGGGTVDGMRKYLTYGTCMGGTALNIVSEIALTGDQMTLLRQNCETLNSPEVVSPVNLQFALGRPSVMKFAGQVYNQQSVLGGQETTLQFCQSSASSVQALIWQNIGNTNSLFGSVTLPGSTGTGPLTVTQTGSTYSTSTGQTSSFNLNLPTSGQPSLTYTLSGNAPVTIAMDCTSQSVPNVNDGSGNALAGTPVNPNLLSGYSVLPPWKVAGVDYAVGVPKGTSLKDPFPGGALDPALVAMGGKVTGLQIDFKGVDNIVIDSFDFSLEGGWAIIIEGNGATVKNSNFKMSSNSYWYISTAGTPVGLNILNNTIDGGTSTFQLLQLQADGTTTIAYNLIKNAYVQFIQALPAASGNSIQIVQNNYFENASEGNSNSWIQDYSQTNGVWKDIEINFNTFVQNAPNAVTQGVSVLSAGNNKASALAESVSNNTIIASATSGVTYAIIVDTTWLNGSAAVNSNYFDTSGIMDAPLFVGLFTTGNAGPYNGTASESGNFNMNSGAALP